MQPAILKQRSDYTYKFNVESGRHGWLRLTPAYSVKIVQELLVESSARQAVLDPFCGSGTTALCSTYHGKKVVSVDINSFLVWLASTKCRHYTDKSIAHVREVGSLIGRSIYNNKLDPISAPPIFDIGRWWNEDELLFLRTLKSGIDSLCDTEGPERDLLLITFCRILIKLSNAAFNHQSMSFKERPTNQLLILDRGTDFVRLFAKDLDVVLSSAQQNPVTTAKIILGDSRDLERCTQDKFDLLITSPPYPNRMSYIRELRPYMYWLGYLKEAREAGDIDWETIGGTWGIATSRLMQWKATSDEHVTDELSQFLSKLTESNQKNAMLLANYVSKYFSDIWCHLNGVRRVLETNAKVNYIVGNSLFYGFVLPVELIYQKMLKSVGFKKVEITPIRKRNSKKALFEYNVSAMSS